MSTTSNLPSRSASLSARLGRALTLFMLPLLTLAPPARAFDRHAFAAAVLAQFAPASWAVVTRYEGSPWEFHLPERSIKMQPTDFMRFVRGQTEVDIVSELPTAVHETCHDYSRKMVWAWLSKRNLPWCDGMVLPIGPQEEVFVPFTPTFPSARFADRIPTALRDLRFDVYVVSKTPDQTTQKLGVYGLLDEFNAYQCGTRTAVDLLAWTRSRGPGTDAAWAQGLQIVEGTYTAHAQLKLFVLAWLTHAQTADPKAYHGFMTNRDALRAYVAIDDAFTKTISRYRRIKRELAATLPLRDVDGRIQVGRNSIVISGDATYARYAGELALPAYVAIERRIRAAAAPPQARASRSNVGQVAGGKTAALCSAR